MATSRSFAARLSVLVAAAALPLSAPSAQEPGRSSGPLLVPLSEQASWQVLRYDQLPPHRLQFSRAGLEIAVEGSAMPLIYALPRPVRAKSIRVKGRVEGTLRIPAGRQGEERFDDYAFRIGLVEPGKRTLGSFQRPFAAAWVRKLFELAPKGGGISRIHFFNVGMDSARIGERRQHPLSDLIVEQIVAVPRPDGHFDFVHSLERPLETIAVWLSSDGDDSGSHFTVLVEQIELQPAP